MRWRPEIKGMTSTTNLRRIKALRLQVACKQQACENLVHSHDEILLKVGVRTPGVLFISRTSGNRFRYCTTVLETAACPATAPLACR